MSLEQGQVIDNKYRIVQCIGEGGMGAVYEGENVRIRRRVAIKVLHKETASSPEVVARFEREAQAAGTIGNDHILEVLDIGALEDGARYIVMEYLDGEPLTKRIERLGRMTPSQLAPLIRQTLEALGAAHGAGIVHRDLKPDNIFILRQKAGRADFVKLIDFGISKFQPYAGEVASKMTRAGAIMGTPHYMSPEQANGSAEADARSDLYAVGIVMYEALTGQVPFDAKTFNELLFQIVLSDPRPPQQLVPDLDPNFAAIVCKAMARARENRFQSAAEFDNALEQWMRGRPLSFPPQPSNTAYNVQGQGFVQAPSAQGRPPVIASTSYNQIPSGSQPGVSTGSQPGVPLGSQPGIDQFGRASVPHPQLSQQTPVPMQQQEPPRGTQNSWNSSQHPLPPTKPASKAPIAIAVIGGVLILGGLAFGASRIFGGGSSKEPSSVNATQEKAADPKPATNDKKKPASKGDDDDDDDKAVAGSKSKNGADGDKSKNGGGDPPAPPSTNASPTNTAAVTPPTPSSTGKSTSTANTLAGKSTTTTPTAPTSKPTSKPGDKGGKGGKTGSGGQPDFGY